MKARKIYLFLFLLALFGLVFALKLLPQRMSVAEGKISRRSSTMPDSALKSRSNLTDTEFNESVNSNPSSAISSSSANQSSRRETVKKVLTVSFQGTDVEYPRSLDNIVPAYRLEEDYKNFIDSLPPENFLETASGLKATIISKKEDLLNYEEFGKYLESDMTIEELIAMSKKGDPAADFAIAEILLKSDRKEEAAAYFNFAAEKTGSGLPYKYAAFAYRADKSDAGKTAYAAYNLAAYLLGENSVIGSIPVAFSNMPESLQQTAIIKAKELSSPSIGVN